MTAPRNEHPMHSGIYSWTKVHYCQHNPTKTQAYFFSDEDAQGRETVYGYCKTCYISACDEAVLDQVYTPYRANVDFKKAIAS